MPTVADGSFVLLDRDHTEPRRKNVLFVILVVLSGVLITISGKTMLSWCSKYGDGGDGRFSKPWFLTLAYFLGMTLCMVPYYISKLVRRIRRWLKSRIFRLSTPEGSFLESSTTSQTLPFSSFLKLAIPAVVDMIATLLTTVGLLWVSASVLQALRSSLSVFSAIISVVFLKRSLFSFHWTGLFLFIIGLAAVSFSSIFQYKNRHPLGCDGQEDIGDDSKHQLQGILGVVFVLFGQLIHACQFALEEFLRCDAELHPLLLVSFQGMWALIISACILPLLNLTSNCRDNYFCPLHVFWHEDGQGTLEMLRNSSELVIIFVVYVVAVIVANISGVQATRFLGLKKRTAVEIGRVIVVWICDLGMYYLEMDDRKLRGETSAEPWVPLSWMQLVGTVLIIAGCLVYNSVIRVKGFYYPSKWTMAEWRERGTIVAEASVDPIWRRSDNRDSDNIRRGFYMRIGINKKKRVTFSPGCTVIPDPPTPPSSPRGSNSSRLSTEPSIN